MRRTRRLAVAILISGAIAGCGGSTEPTIPDIETTTFAPSLGIDLSLMTKTASGLYYRDLTVGTGTTATVGKTVSLYYNGYLVDGTQFDARTTGQSPYTVVVGAGAVIPGFDEGLRGMAPGGVRQIIIPPALAYGANGSGPIPPYAIIVFRLQVTAVQ